MIKMDTLVDYWQKRGHALADEAAKYLEKRDEELQAALAEQEKAKKAKKKSKEPEPEINPDDYKRLSRELLLKMLEKRLEEEDCNAGAIFDNLKSDQWADEKFAVDLICEAVGIQNVQVVIFKPNTERKDEEEEGLEVCTNYRYMRRNVEEFAPKKEPEPVVEKPKKAAPKVKGGKKSAEAEKDEAAR